VAKIALGMRSFAGYHWFCDNRTKRFEINQIAYLISTYPQGCPHFLGITPLCALHLWEDIIDPRSDWFCVSKNYLQVGKKGAY
jgi:hypothetical protein